MIPHNPTLRDQPPRRGHRSLKQDRGYNDDRAHQAISVLLFPIASMLAVGLSFTFRQILGPLRYPDSVFRALVANFILVPLLALGISRLLALDPSLAAGMALVGSAAGAPFLLKLTRVANADV